MLSQDQFHSISISVYYFYRALLSGAVLQRRMSEGELEAASGFLQGEEKEEEAEERGKGQEGWQRRWKIWSRWSTSWQAERGRRVGTGGNVQEQDGSTHFL